MRYFETLPKVLTADQNGNPILLTNILARSQIKEAFQTSPLLFYEYDIQDGDTPEIIATKYYDDPFRYWIVLFSNQILDPIWEWPMNYTQFEDYINNKYAEAAQQAGDPVNEYVRQTIHSYEKIITTTTDNFEETVNVVKISEAEYNLTNISQNTYTIPGGYSATVKTDKRIVYLYDYEYEKNEARRRIKLLNTQYVGLIEDQFKLSMGIER